MPDKTFKPGDVVALKSRSAEMTVQKQEGDIVKCVYFNQVSGSFEAKSFFAVTLTLIKASNA